MIWASTSGWGRRCAAILAATMLTGTAIAGPVVIRATGPSAKAYPAGRQLPDNALLALKAGDTVMLLDGRGTRTLSGPGSFPAVATGQRAGTAQTAARILANTGSSERRGGAVRGPGTAASESRSPNLWLVDLSKSGSVCVVDTNAVRMWRAGSDKAGAVKISSGAQSATVNMAAGATIAEWPKAVPVTDGGEYVVAVEGQAPTKVRFMVMPAPSGLEDTASKLISKGCNTQLDLLVASTSAGGNGD